MAEMRRLDYPEIALDAALEAVRPASRKSRQGRMSRAELARHLGYASLDRPALGMIGVVTAYGLIEGSGDELRISDDAMTALLAPPGSSDRREALGRMAVRPSLFQALRRDFPDLVPSEENLCSSLVNRGFPAPAAAKAARSFVESVRLAEFLTHHGDGGVSDDPVPQLRPLSAGPLHLGDPTEGERIVFAEKRSSRQYVRLVASGEVDASLLDAVDDYVRRQRKLLGISRTKDAAS